MCYGQLIAFSYLQLAPEAIVESEALTSLQHSRFCPNSGSLSQSLERQFTSRDRDQVRRDRNGLIELESMEGTVDFGLGCGRRWGSTTSGEEDRERRMDGCTVGCFDRGSVLTGCSRNEKGSFSDSDSTEETIPVFSEVTE